MVSNEPPWAPPGGMLPQPPPGGTVPQPPPGGMAPQPPRPGGVPPVPYVAPPAGYPYLPPPPVPQPLPRGVPRLKPTRIDPVPGTQFGVAIPALNPTVSGLGVGSMVAGIGAALVSLAVWCFGLVGAPDGWGALVAGAFAALAVAVGAGAVGTAIAALRQIRQSSGQLTGRGLAIAGLAGGGAGAGLAVAGLLLAILLQTG